MREILMLILKLKSMVCYTCLLTALPARIYTYSSPYLLKFKFKCSRGDELSSIPIQKA
jgi:hypothetical protein